MVDDDGVGLCRRGGHVGDDVVEEGAGGDDGLRCGGGVVEGAKGEGGDDLREVAVVEVGVGEVADRFGMPDTNAGCGEGDAVMHEVGRLCLGWGLGEEDTDGSGGSGGLDSDSGRQGDRLGGEGNSGGMDWVKDRSPGGVATAGPEGGVERPRWDSGRFTGGEERVVGEAPEGYGEAVVCADGVSAQGRRAEGMQGRDAGR